MIIIFRSGGGRQRARPHFCCALGRGRRASPRCGARECAGGRRRRGSPRCEGGRGERRTAKEENEEAEGARCFFCFEIMTEYFTYLMNFVLLLFFQKKKKSRQNKKTGGGGAAGGIPESTPCDPLLQLWRDNCRLWCCRLYAFATPTTAALDTLADCAPLLELGAGTGYWAAQLRRTHPAAQIKAWDSHPARCVFFSLAIV